MRPAVDAAASAHPLTQTRWAGLRFASVLLALALVFAAVARQYAVRYSLSRASALSIFACFFLLLTFALAPASDWARCVIPKWLPGWRRLLIIPVWLLPYLVYAAGTGDFRPAALLRLLAIAAPAPLLYTAFPVRSLYRFAWQDALLGSWLLTAVLTHLFTPVWTTPVHLDFLSRLFLVAVAATTWTFVRPVPGLGYRFAFSRRLGKAAAVNFLCFSLCAIPFGFLLHFIAWHPHFRGPLPFAVNYLEIFLFIALLEELFFRGFLQNLLSRTCRVPWHGQFIASFLFGLSHVFHAPVPNWRYVLLATIAGWFYGQAFRSGGGIFASALTHAMVDTTWRTWFSLH